MKHSPDQISERVSLGYYYRATERVFDGMTSGVYGTVSEDELRTSWELNFRAARRIEQWGLSPTVTPKDWPTQRQDVAQVLDAIFLLTRGGDSTHFDLTEKQLAKSFEARHETSEANREILFRELSIHILLAIGTVAVGLLLRYDKAMVVCSLAVVMGISGVFLLMRQGYEKRRKIISRGLLLAAGYVLLIEVILFLGILTGKALYK